MSVCLEFPYQRNVVPLMHIQIPPRCNFCLPFTQHPFPSKTIMGPFYINFLYIVYIFPQMYENEHETIQNSCTAFSFRELFLSNMGPISFLYWCGTLSSNCCFPTLLLPILVQTCHEGTVFFFGWPCEYFCIILFCPVVVARLFFEINYKDIQMGYLKGNSTCNLLVQPCTQPDFVQLKLHPPSSLFVILYLFYILF